ncbi:alpha/beta hydrolase family protein [Amycolatopsis sp. NPDC059657]|uniref:alpha/beta hydrolase family protein n=1 Tax=Amycolatopsis sp. NPDC059657 TaxID=3346899 RepID=UPI00367231F9
MFREITALAVATLLTTSGVAQASDKYTLDLPPPTGPGKVGTTALHLEDPSRQDPWNPAVHRELMVSVYYPASDTRGRAVAPQFTPGAAERFEAFDTVYLHPQLPQGKVDWGATKTHSYLDAPAQRSKHPVILYTPGGAEPRTLGSGIAEDLASRGFVVVTMDHTGEASEVEFPDGVRPIQLPPDPAEFPQTIRKSVDARVADTKFVLDQLERLAGGTNPDVDGKPLPANLSRALDLRRIGMYGHSLGGGVAVKTTYEDRRIDATVSMESYLSYWPAPQGQPREIFPVAQQGTKRPLLLLTSERGQDDDMRSDWAHLLASGQARRVHYDDAAHYVFTDYGPMARQLHRAGLMTTDGLAALVGTADHTRAIRGAIADFFTCALR